VLPGQRRLPAAGPRLWQRQPRLRQWRRAAPLRFPLLPQLLSLLPRCALRRRRLLLQQRAPPPVQRLGGLKQRPARGVGRAQLLAR
jgi:hypothetical protein